MCNAKEIGSLERPIMPKNCGLIPNNNIRSSTCSFITIVQGKGLLSAASILVHAYLVAFYFTFVEAAMYRREKMNSA